MALTVEQLPGPIVVGFGEAVAAPEAVESLVRARFKVVAFVRRGSRCALRRHRGLELHEITPPEVDAFAATADIADLASRFGAIAVMPLDDPSLWLCDQVGGLAGIRVLGPTGDQARLALDKRLQIDLARTAGLAVPPTEIYDQTVGLPDVSAFPVVLRPALALYEQDGKLARSGTRVCADADELRAAADDLGSGPILVQPFLRGGGEGLFGLAVGGAVHHWSAHRRLRMVDPQGSGSSACISKTPEPGMTEPGGRMMADAGWRGLFMLEFLRDRAGTPWFMELNGRTWGSLALARRLGLEYPAWAALEALELGHPSALPRLEGDSPVVCRHLGREILHVAAVMRGPKSVALSDWPSRWDTLRTVARIRRGDRWYNWSADNPAIFVEDTAQTLRAAWQRKRAS
jgi:predicted ATP-grasp superfamily ATP-dependent carboligase